MWAVARQRCARARAIRLGRCIRGISSDRRKVLHMGHSHGGGGGGHGHSHSPIDLDNLPEEAGKKAQRITWIGMGANAGLCVAKGGIGFYSGSASLVADAAHSVSDMVSDVVALIAVKIGRKPADSKQPYGYGHYETLGTLAVAGMLVGAGFGSAFHGVDHLIPLMTGKHVEPVCMVPAAMACALVSVAIKEWLYQVTVKVGKEVRSQVLIANAWHHRTDAFSSIVALLGVGGSAMGFPYLDPIGAIMVSGMIMKTGVEIGWEAVHYLVDAQVNERVLDEVKAIGRDLSEEGHIKNVHNVRCRRLGHYVLVDLHVMVDEYLTVTAAHEAAQRVEHQIKYKLPEVAEVMIHLDAELDHRSPTVENEAHPDRGEASDNDGLKPASSDSHHPIAKGSSRSAAIIGKKDDGDEHKSSADFPMSSSQTAGSDAPSPSPSPPPPPPTATAAATATGTEPSPRRTQQEIEADILEVFASVQENQKVLSSLAHMSLHYLRPSSSSSSSSSSLSSSSSQSTEENHHHSSYVLAEISLVLDSGVTVAAAKMAAVVLREEILKSIDDIGEVDIHMELLHGMLKGEMHEIHRARHAK